MWKELFTKGSIEAGIGAGLGVLVNAVLLGNSSILANAIAAGVGALFGSIVRVFILKR